MDEFFGKKTWKFMINKNFDKIYEVHSEGLGNQGNGRSVFVVWEFEKRNGKLILQELTCLIHLIVWVWFTEQIL